MAWPQLPRSRNSPRHQLSLQPSLQPSSVVPCCGPPMPLAGVCSKGSGGCFGLDAPGWAPAAWWLFGTTSVAGGRPGPLLPRPLLAWRVWDRRAAGNWSGIGPIGGQIPCQRWLDNSRAGGGCCCPPIRPSPPSCWRWSGRPCVFTGAAKVGCGPCCAAVKPSRWLAPGAPPCMGWQWRRRLGRPWPRPAGPW